MNNGPQQHTIWTIGHSTHELKVFLAMLEAFRIEMLVDVRRFPASRKFPHFNGDALEVSLAENGIKYLHIKELGGRRNVSPDSKNTVWRHPAFRGYADYMETEAFCEGIKRLEEVAIQRPSAMMCSEAVWWRCHRSLVSDFLKAKGWKVMHIMNREKTVEHPYTGPARIENGRLTYWTQ